MHRKLWRLCIVAILATGLFTFTDTAINPTPPTSAAFPGACWDEVWENWHVGMSNEPTAGNVHKVNGIAAWLDLSNALCTWTTGNENANDRGAAAWVGIQCYNSVTGSCSGNKLIQIGVLRCYWDDQDDPAWYSTHVCSTTQHAGDYVNFWAAGGCNGYGLEPHYISENDGGEHRFKLVEEAGNVMAGYIDNVRVVSFDRDSNIRVNCWGTSQTMAPVDFERFDQGDGYGYSAGKATARDIIWKRPDFNGGAFQPVTYTPSATCKQHAGVWHYPMNNGQGTSVNCDVTGTDDFAVWNS